MAIKPGAMGAKTWPVTPPEFAESLAAEIEAILSDLLVADGLRPLPDDNSKESRDRRRLLVAIARGLVKHLDQRRNSITISHPDTAVTTSPSFDIEGKDWS